MEKHNFPIKIGFTGAHGVGKTTLSGQVRDELKKQFINATVLETPRYICKLANDDEYLRRGHNNHLKQSLILLGQLVNEYKSLINNNILVQICDRLIIDHWCYTTYLFEEDFQSENLASIYEHFVLEHCKSYDIIYYYPVERHPVDDGVRESDISYQLAIDKKIFSFLEQHKIPYKRISSKVAGYQDEIIKDIRALVYREDSVNLPNEL